MLRRLCEVSAMVDGQRHSLEIEAESLYHAVCYFFGQCASPPPGATPPKLNTETIVEVRPVYQVRVGDAMRGVKNKSDKPRALGLS